VQALHPQCTSAARAVAILTLPRAPLHTPNAQDRAGRTALSYAAMYGSTDCIYLLAARGADVAHIDTGVQQRACVCVCVSWRMRSRSSVPPCSLWLDDGDAAHDTAPTSHPEQAGMRWSWLGLLPSTMTQQRMLTLLPHPLTAATPCLHLHALCCCCHRRQHAAGAGRGQRPPVCCRRAQEAAAAREDAGEAQGVCVCVCVCCFCLVAGRLGVRLRAGSGLAGSRAVTLIPRCLPSCCACDAISR
jgi:hypothetical protein